MSIHLAYCTNLPNSSGALYHHKFHWKLPQTFLSTIFPFFHKYMIFPKLNNNSHHKTSSIPILPNIFFSCLHCLLLENNLHFRCNLPITHSLLTFDPLAFDLWSYFQTKRASLSWTFLYFLQHWSSLLKGLMLSLLQSIPFQVYKREQLPDLFHSFLMVSGPLLSWWKGWEVRTDRMAGLVDRKFAGSLFSLNWPYVSKQHPSMVNY